MLEEDCLIEACCLEELRSLYLISDCAIASAFHKLPAIEMLSGECLLKCVGLHIGCPLRNIFCLAKHISDLIRRKKIRASKFHLGQLQILLGSLPAECFCRTPSAPIAGIDLTCAIIGFFGSRLDHILHPIHQL